MARFVPPPKHGSDHHAWKGDKVGYVALHVWMQRHFPKVGRCEYCGCTGKRTEYASAGHRYTRNRADWFELCRRCHDAFDGPMSQETREKISASLKGRPLSEEARAKMIAALKGRPHSPEHRAKIAAALKRGSDGRFRSAKDAR